MQRIPNMRKLSSGNTEDLEPIALRQMKLKVGKLTRLIHHRRHSKTVTSSKALKHTFDVKHILVKSAFEKNAHKNVHGWMGKMFEAVCDMFVDKMIAALFCTN